MPAYIDLGLYGKHLSRWLEYIPKNRLKVIFYEDLFADPHRVLSDIYRHIGVDPDHSSLIERERRHASDMPRLPWLRQALRAAGDHMRSLGMEDVVLRLKPFAPLKRLLTYNAIPLKTLCPPLTSDERAALALRFQGDARRMEAMLGQLVPWDGLTSGEIAKVDKPLPGAAASDPMAFRHRMGAVGG